MRRPWLGLTAALAVLFPACRRSDEPARALEAEIVAKPDAGPDVAPIDGGPHIETVLADAMDYAPVRGRYLFREQCPGAASENTWIFDVQRSDAELAIGAKRERVRLFPMPTADEASALVVLPETALAPLFRVIPEGGVLRLIPLDSAGWFGNFRPSCTAPGDVVFLESKIEAAQDWASRALGPLKLRYPRKVLTVVETPSSVELFSPDVFGIDNSGGRWPFRVRITVHELPVLAVVKKQLPSSFAALFPGGTAASFKPSEGFADRRTVAGRPTYRISMGIEGTNTRTDYVELTPARTLSFAVYYATEFSNAKITKSAFEQLAIADVILRSLQP